MPTAIVTGSAGLIGAETVTALCGQGVRVFGIDNDMRRVFCGEDASTSSTRLELERLPLYTHLSHDVRDDRAVGRLFEHLETDVSLVVHAAAQPSLDGHARDPLLDFDVNAAATLRLLEHTRRHCPEAVFIFTSTRDVYGDTPNRLPLVELDTRWEIDPAHPYRDGIDETMSIDGSLHSVFGASKVAADVLVQEYGRYFGMKTVVFRCGCISGTGLHGAEPHGFLAHLMKCTAAGRPYMVHGCKGKQVRDNLHAADLVEAFLHVWRAPRRGGCVYNMGGGRDNHCSMLEAIDLCQRMAGRRLAWTYRDRDRRGDHVWYVSSRRRFELDYPGWRLQHGLEALLRSIHDRNIERWTRDEDALPAWEPVPARLH